MIQNSEEIKEQINDDYSQFLNIKNIPEAIEKRIGMEIEKYKNLQLRKFKIYKQIIVSQIENHMQNMQKNDEGKRK